MYSQLAFVQKLESTDQLVIANSNLKKGLHLASLHLAFCRSGDVLFLLES